MALKRSPIRVLFDGVSIEVEDPDTAIELAEKIAKRKGSQQASQVSLERGPMKEHDVPGEGSGAQAPEDAWAALMEALSAPHHRLLALIKEKEAIAIDELAQALGAKNNSVIAGRTRCTKPVFRRASLPLMMRAWTRSAVQREAVCSSEGRGGGTVREPMSRASSSGSRRARVASQYLGASSR